jgi:hypothetical protein
MKNIEKDDSRSLKREKLKKFLSERRSQNAAQATVEKKRKAGKTKGVIPESIGQSFKRQQLLLYLERRKAGGTTLAIQRRESRRTIKEAVSEATPVPVIPVTPEIIPSVAPAPVAPPEKPSEAVKAEAIVAPVAVPLPVTLPPVEPPEIVKAEETAPPVAIPLPAKPSLPTAKAKMVAESRTPKPRRKPFNLISFLKTDYIRIVFILLVLGWFLEVFMLYKRLGAVWQQVEQASSISRPHPSGMAITTIKTLPPVLETLPVEGVRDPFSNELWRIQEIAPAPAVRIRPVKVPTPPNIIKSTTPILIVQPPEFVPPEVTKAIPDSAKLAATPLPVRRVTRTPASQSVGN